MSTIQQAWQAFTDGRLDEAERLCRSMLITAPGDLRAVLLLADICLSRGNFAEAATLTERALAGVPNQPDALALRGEAIALLGNAGEALACLDRTIHQRLIHPRAHAARSAILARLANPTPRYTVSVITPTVGTNHLRQAIASVQSQTYPLVSHWVVADGPECYERVRGMLPSAPRHLVRFLPLPVNVGDGGFCGHRVYGAAGYLVDGEFVAFLDEDNWYEPDHLASLMELVTARGWAWTHSLRKIVDSQGQFVCNDDCASLGHWPFWCEPALHLVDVNCYLLRRDVAIGLSPLWYRRYRDGENPDFTICRQLTAQHSDCGGSGSYSVNYRVGANAAMTIEQFMQGNAATRERHGDVFPWQRNANNATRSVERA